MSAIISPGDHRFSRFSHHPLLTSIRAIHASLLPKKWRPHPRRSSSFPQVWLRRFWELHQRCQRRRSFCALAQPSIGAWPSSRCAHHCLCCDERRASQSKVRSSTAISCKGTSLMIIGAPPCKRPLLFHTCSPQLDLPSHTCSPYLYMCRLLLGPSLLQK